MKKSMFIPWVVSLLLAGCNLGTSAKPTPTPPGPGLFDSVSTETSSQNPAVSLTPIFTPTATPLPPVAPSVCADPQVTSLIDSLRTSMLTADGALLGSLVSPDGMDVRYFRNGRVVTYTPYQAQFLYETTYPVEWGSDPASGIEKRGSFHDVIVPDLVKLLEQPYTLHCNEIRHGGASYEVAWPYDRDFYSIHFTGTEANGFLDWHTWVVGVEYDNGRPYIYALMPFHWEP